MRHFNTCCFIGSYLENQLLSYEENNQLYKELKEKIIELIENFSVAHFISGMELGFEQCAAETVIELKTKYPKIFLECVIPYETQAINWTENKRDMYYSIIKESDKEVMLQCHYTHDCQRKRDLYMINKSKYIIICNSSTSINDKLIKYAKCIGRIVFTIDLETLKITPSIKICK